MPNEENLELIGRTNWRDEEQRWDLQGMARAMYEWLGNPVTGSRQIEGWEATGTLDPDNPDPTKIQPPPSWRTPEVTMQSTCAWFAGALQDYLFGSGLMPLVRASIDEDGHLQQLAGTKQSVATGRIVISALPMKYAYYILLDQEDAAYPLTDTTSITVTPVSVDEAIFAQVIPVSYRQPLFFHDVLSAAFEKYVGWFYQFKDAGLASAYIHIHA